jgi:hypothetical protein
MKNNKQLIEETRKRIQKLQTEQDDVYNQMISIIKPEEDMEAWIWDYCFNCYDENSEYDKKVKENIYGSSK